MALDDIRRWKFLLKETRFTSLLHHVNVASLREAFYALKHKAGQESNKRDSTLTRLQFF